MTEVSRMDPQDDTRAALPADPMVSMIERLVLNPDADLDKLERMLAMRERMDEQNARIGFARALSQARAEIPPIIKDATVNYKNKDGKTTHYQHETLSGIARAIDPILSHYGLSYRFRTDQGQGGVRVTCIVQHSDGHAEETTLSGSPDGSGSKNGFQAVGSAVTYLQRYTLKAALGLSAEKDDDAQSATPAQDPSPRQHQRPAPSPPPAERDPDEIRDSLLEIVRVASDADDLNAKIGGAKFDAAWQWLADNHAAHSAAVRRAVDEMREKFEPQPNADLGGDEIPY